MPDWVDFDQDTNGLFVSFTPFKIERDFFIPSTRLELYALRNACQNYLPLIENLLFSWTLLHRFYLHLSFCWCQAAWNCVIETSVWIVALNFFPVPQNWLNWLGDISFCVYMNATQLVRQKIAWCTISQCLPKSKPFFFFDAELTKQTSTSFFRLEILTTILIFRLALQKNQQQQRRKWISRLKKMAKNERKSEYRNSQENDYLMSVYKLGFISLCLFWTVVAKWKSLVTYSFSLWPMLSF